MEKTLSVEERIKKAEEIYARRHEREPRNSTTLYLNGKGKKDIKVFRKLIIQMVVCLLIYLVVYVIQNSNYFFSEGFINKAKEILSTDINFGELYNNTKESIKGIFRSEEQKSDENIGGSNEEVKGEVKEKQNEKAKESKESEVTKKQEEKKEEQVVELSEEEKQIKAIKETTSFIKPVEGTISSKYGLRDPTTSTVPKNHTGTDIAANTGTKIISSTDGEVVLSSSEGDYGNHLKIQIGEVSIIYAHCSKLYVKQGEKVKQGQEIAEVGSTGNSTGPHLHFEIRYKENTVDPEKILEL